MAKRRIHLIAAARPNFMKVAPLYHALSRTEWAAPVLVHTGQHYDRNMSDAILADLGLPAPDYHLGIGSGTHAEQTGKVMIAYEQICLEDAPDLTVVVGDVNPTAACAIVCAKLWIPVAHLEAGLRSGDRRMPEEINRLVTDAISDYLWTPSEDASRNLLREGVAAEKVELVGNIMIDSFEMLRGPISAAGTRQELGLEESGYAVVTLHRPSNVDALETIEPIIDSLMEVASRLPVVFVAHPRTINSLKSLGLMHRIEREPGIQLVQPLPYAKFMNLVTGAKAVITDSGGLQEETSYLGIPCLTMRDNTERPVTIELGTNVLIDSASLGSKLADVLRGEWKPGEAIPLWDGRTADRLVSILRKTLTE